MSRTFIGEQLPSPGSNSLYDAAPEDMRLLLVSPQAVSALWSALWTLEDSLTAVQRLKALSSPPPYADGEAERIQHELNLLRELLRTL